MLLVDRVVARILVDKQQEKEGVEQKEGGNHEQRAFSTDNKIGIELADFEGGEVEEGTAAVTQDDKKADVQTISKTTGIILAFAMGFHAFFEGIAFGLLAEVNLAFQLSIGIIIHKTAAAVSLGGAFANTGYSFVPILILTIVFAICAPIVS